jgi:HrpA-like RNA helicase
MSATLRLSDFVDNKALFSIAPPVLKAEGRQHPVSACIAFPNQTSDLSRLLCISAGELSTITSKRCSVNYQEAIENFLQAVYLFS